MPAGWGVTGSGELIVAGRSGPDSATDRLLLSYSREDSAFTDASIPPQPGFDLIQSVSSAEAFSYVAGAVSPEDSDQDIWYGRYEGTTLSWEATVDQAGADDVAIAVATAPDGLNFAVAGSVTNKAGDEDGWIRLMSRLNGQERWTETWAGEAGTDQAARGLAFNASGAVIVVGDTEVVGQSLNVWVQSYATSGALGWSASFDGGVGDDSPRGIAVGPDESVYVCGTSAVAGEGRNAWLGKYSASGQDLGFTTLAGEAAQDDVANGCVIAGDLLIVTGVLFAADNNRNLFVAAFEL